MKLFNQNKNILKKLKKITSETTVIEPIISRKSDGVILEQFSAIKESVRNSGRNQLDILSQEVEDIIGLFREATKRTIGERPHDQQIWAGLALYEGFIIDMKNGEGKTLSAVLPALLEYVCGSQIHILTYNDYLSQRDSEWMGQIFSFFDIQTGYLTNDMDQHLRHQAYDSDVLYSTSLEIGFDYLKDHMKFDKNSLLQKKISVAIVDEIDSILIDEARTPVIISGPQKRSHEFYHQADQIISRLSFGDDYTISQFSYNADFTDIGIEKMESMLGTDNLYDPSHTGMVHILKQALKANMLFKRDVDYVVQDDEVVIVDEKTGRLKPKSRYSEGLHQALEIKEKVPVQEETQTLSMITIQNLLKHYKKLSGMSGTAFFDQEEYKDVYGKHVISIPSRFDTTRKDGNDFIYSTKAAALFEACRQAAKCYQKGQPALIGTLSIEKAEEIAAILDHNDIPYELLNPKHHEREAEILEKAGQPNAITIAAKMAGRGTDIKITPEVDKLGGLFVIGVERNESLRMDEQLKGRAGRHGKLGCTQFFLSLEDDLLKTFGGDRIKTVMEKLSIEEYEHIDHPFITKAIQNAQKKVEYHNYKNRKQLLDYDIVLDKHRSNIFDLRMEIIKSENTMEIIPTMIENVLHRTRQNLVRVYPVKSRDFIQEYTRKIQHIVQDLLINPFEDQGKTPIKILEKWARNLLTSVFNEKEKNIGKDIFEQIFQHILLQTMDERWKKHLNQLEMLKSKSTMKIYSTDDFLSWYRIESDRIFDELIFKIEYETLKILSAIKINDHSEDDDSEDSFDDVVNGEEPLEEENDENRSSETEQE